MPTTSRVLWMNWTADEAMLWLAESLLAISKYSWPSLEKLSSPIIEYSSSSLSGSLGAREERREPKRPRVVMLL